MKRAKALMIFSAALLTVICGAAVFSVAHLQTPYVARINNIPIRPAEFYVYFYEQKKRFESRGGADIWDTDFDGETAENVAKQQALNSAALVKISARQAAKAGVSLNDEQKKEAAQAASGIYEQNKDALSHVGVTVKDMEGILLENELYRQYYLKITDSYIMNEEEFETYFNEYYESNRHTLERVGLHYIVFRGGDAAERAEETSAFLGERLNADPFIEIFDAQGGDGLEHDAANDIFPQEVTTAAYALDKGEMSEVIATSQGSYILYVTTREPADLDALKQNLQAQYTGAGKNEIFNREYTAWYENYRIVKNTVLWNRISIRDF